MSWVKKDLWVPGELALDTKLDRPLILIADREAHPIVRDEIEESAPDFQVYLIVPGQNLYGIRARGFVYSKHINWLGMSDTKREQLHRWHDMGLLCRVERGGDKEDFPE